MLIPNYVNRPAKYACLYQWPECHCRWNENQCRCFLLLIRISLCESILICAVVEWRSNYCYLASEADFPQNATISAVDPIKTVVILQNHLTLNTRLLAKQFDITTKRGKRYKISHDGKTYTRLRDRCGEFCCFTDGCRGFEVSNRTDFVFCRLNLEGHIAQGFDRLILKLRFWHSHQRLCQAKRDMRL